MKGINIFTLKELIKNINENSIEIEGKWYPVRPIGFKSLIARIRIARKVFIGKYDVIIWPKNQ